MSDALGAVMTTTTELTAARGALAAPSARDRARKRERVLAVLEERGADSVVLRSHTALAWYLDGARTHVSFAADPVLALVVGRGGDELRIYANEADRLLEEELGGRDDGFGPDLHGGAGGAAGAGTTLRRVPWHEPLLPDAVPGRLDESEVAAELRAARAELLPAELARYRALCRETAEVLSDAAFTARPDEPERAVAARLAGGLTARGIDPLVVLVAGRSRLAHRHPLPGGAPLGDRAMLVVCGRRHGLIANATRWVRWGPDGGAEPEARREARREADAQRRILEVERTFFDATHAAALAGQSLGAAFERGISGYADAGFDPAEWRRHHQGGAAGYAGRDPRALPGIADPVRIGQAFAWNPSAPGAKVEDTVLLTAGGIEALTVDPRWPTVSVGGLERPAELDISELDTA